MIVIRNDFIWDNKDIFFLLSIPHANFSIEISHHTSLEKLFLTLLADINTGNVAENRRISCYANEAYCRSLTESI